MESEQIIKIELAEDRLPPPFAHPSGKSNLRALLIKLMPEHRVYCEPFCGFASVFFAKPPAEKEILNDIDSCYPEVLRFLKSATEEDWERLRKREWRPAEKRWEELRQSEPKERLDKVYRLMYLLRYGFRGRMRAGNYSQAQAGKTAPEFPEALWNRRAFYKTRLKDTLILEKDFESVIKEFDSANTLFYLDPPYIPGPESHAQGFEGSSASEATAIINKLCDLLKSLKGKWLLTHAEQSEARKLFGKLGEIRTVAMPTPDPRAGTVATRREMIAANFKLPERLRMVHVHKGIEISSIELTSGLGCPILKKIGIQAINPTSLKQEGDKELLNLHFRTHQLWGMLGDQESLDGTSREDLANAHYFIVQEMADRKFEHHLHDSLDATLREAPYETKISKAYMERGKPAWRIFELEDLDEIEAFKAPDTQVIVEVKWDGERIQLLRQKGKVEIWSDYPKRVDHRLPYQTDELAAMKQDDFRLDSEAIMLDVEKKEALHRTMATALLNGKFDPTERAKMLHIVVFDCLEIDGKDARQLPLLERLDKLKGFKSTDHIHFLTDYMTDDPAKDALVYLLSRDNKQFPKIVEKVMEK